MRLVLASRNAHKARELGEILTGWEVEPLATEAEPPDETGATFAENARLKARFGRGHADPDAWVVGEDSGLEVEGLGGAPGVRSARFAGSHGDDAANLERLLVELAGVEGDGRRGRYVCELVGDRSGRSRARGPWGAGRPDRGGGPGHGGLRVRPGVRAGRRDAHRGRARRHLEGAAQPPGRGCSRPRRRARSGCERRVESARGALLARHEGRRAQPDDALPEPLEEGARRAREGHGGPRLLRGQGALPRGRDRPRVLRDPRRRGRGHEGRRDAHHPRARGLLRRDRPRSAPAPHRDGDGQDRTSGSSS